MKTIKEFFDFRKGELQPALLMATFFFAVITAFHILKPLKKGVFVEHIGANRELFAKNLNIVAAILAMIAFTFLYNRLGGRRLVYFLSGFFLAALLVFSTLIGDAPQPGANWSFYIFGDLWTTIWVATFWAFLNETSTSDQSKRLYGVIGAGGSVGGVLGATLVASLVRQYSARPLILLCAALAALIPVVVWWIDRLARRPGAALTYRRRTAKIDTVQANAAIEGAKLVMASRYLLAIVAIMALYELTSQIIEFQFSTGLEAEVEGSRATTAFVAQRYVLMNSLALVVQLFFASFIMRRFGLGPALMVLPVVTAITSGTFLAMPTLMAGSLMLIFDNGLNYSINQTARETLYVPTSSDEQYKARAFTNMFVQRAGKGIATVIAAAFIFIGVRWLSLVTIAIAIAWIAIARFAGRRFQELSQEREEVEMKIA